MLVAFCYNLIMVDIYNQFKDFKSFEVMFYDTNSELQKLFCTVKSIENTRIIINTNNEKNKNVIADIGSELKLYIYTDSGIYSAVSKVLLCTKGIMNTEYVITYPTNSRHSQRREYFRADILTDFNIEATLSMEDHTEKENDDDKFSVAGKTKNICGKGMSFVSNKPFPECSSIQISLNFKERKVDTTAGLVYTKQIMVDNRPKYIHAFTFINISKKNIDFIVKKCFLHQLNLRKNKV